MEHLELISSRFTNSEKTIMEAVYNDKSDDNNPFAFIIEAKEDDVNYQNLSKDISEDQLHESTYNHITEERKTFEEVNGEVKEQLETKESAERLKDGWTIPSEGKDFK